MNKEEAKEGRTLANITVSLPNQKSSETPMSDSARSQASLLVFCAGHSAGVRAHPASLVQTSLCAPCKLERF